MLSREKLLGMKLEATAGTAEEITAAECIYHVFDHQPGTPPNKNPRPAQGGIGAKTSTVPAKSASYGFSVHAYGGETVPPWAALLFPALGCKITDNVITPGSQADYKTLTLGYFMGKGTSAELHKWCGWMGNGVWTFTNGQIVPVVLSGQGKILKPVKATRPTFVIPAVDPPRFVDAELTIGTHAVITNQVVFDQGNQVSMREDVNDETGCGYLCANVASRAPTFTVAPEVADALDVLSWEDYWEECVTLPISYKLKSPLGNIIIAAGQCEVLNYPGQQDRNGQFIKNLVLQALEANNTPNSEYSITFEAPAP